MTGKRFDVRRSKMGYNRAGTRRKARLKRRKRYEERLAAKAAQAQAGTKRSGGVVARAKEAVKTVADVVTGAAQGVAEGLRGKKGE
jgi:hypothetical protein